MRDPARQLKTIGQGAATQVGCATAPQSNGMGGVYCENVDIAPVMMREPEKMDMADAMRLTGVVPYAIDPAFADELWELSERLLDI